MRVLWKDVEIIIQGLLRDEQKFGGVPVRYDGEILRAWWNLAQSRLISLVPIPRFQVYDQPPPYPIPELFYKGRVLHISEKRLALRHLTIEQALIDHEVGYYLIDRQLYLSGVEISGNALLLYDSYLPKVTSDESPVRTPEWAIEACAVYVCIEAATREAMADARYRKFAQPTDAPGNPTHNPFVTVAKYLEERFNAIIATHSTDEEVMREE